MAEPRPFTVTDRSRGKICQGSANASAACLPENATTELLCDVRSVAPDAVTVDALARLQLAAHRNGRKVRLQNASPELLELVDFMALDNVLRA